MNVFIQDRVYELLERFDADLTHKNSSIMKVDLLTPDSSAVLILKPDNFYVLYLEDFVDDVDTISKVITQWSGAEFRKFILPAEASIFADRNAYFKNPAPGTTGWQKYSVNAGGDNSFLAEISTPPGEGYWEWASEYAQ